MSEWLLEFCKKRGENESMRNIVRPSAQQVSLKDTATSVLGHSDVANKSEGLCRTLGSRLANVAILPRYVLSSNSSYDDCLEL